MEDERENRQMLSRIISQLNLLTARMEKMNLAEYVALFEDPRRLIWMNFVAGIARGVGMAVGFTLLGALVLYVLQHAFVANLPVIGNFIADLIEIVERKREEP